MRKILSCFIISMVLLFLGQSLYSLDGAEVSSVGTEKRLIMTSADTFIEKEVSIKEVSGHITRIIFSGEGYDEYEAYSVYVCIEDIELRIALSNAAQREIMPIVILSLDKGLLVTIRYEANDYDSKKGKIIALTVKR